MPLTQIQLANAVADRADITRAEAKRVLAAFEEVVEASRAYDIALDAFDLGALADGHLGLADRARTREVDRNPTEKVEDPHAALETLAAHFDEFVAATLEPRRHHAPVLMPDGAESIPVAGVSPDDPILQQLANGPAVCLFVARMGGHELRLSVCLSTLRACAGI